jgi:transmembrane sensor
VTSEDRLAKATEWFIRDRADEAQDSNQHSDQHADRARLKEWLEEHPDNAKAWREVCATWDVVGRYASSPGIMAGQREALEDARAAREQRRFSRARFRPWHGLAAGLVGALVIFLALWHSGAWRGELYETGVGDRRVLTLADGSTVNLDARSRLRVAFRNDARLIDLEAGQASFEVAKDPTKPFRVRAGGHTVIALGTQFNVEIVRETLLVTLLEGRVAVVDSEPDAGADSARGDSARPGDTSVELTPGQQLVATGREEPKVRSDVDLGRATAWQDGKLFFNDEPLADAAERMNRYAQVQIEVDPAIDHIGISGVFKAGDTNAFMDAVTSYFPVRAERTEDGHVRLAAGRQ